MAPNPSGSLQAQRLAERTHWRFFVVAGRGPSERVTHEVAEAGATDRPLGGEGTRDGSATKAALHSRPTGSTRLVLESDLNRLDDAVK
jgi:hypothetical protein